MIPLKEMSLEQKTILQKLKDELGVDTLPKVLILEADMETLKLQKYFYPFMNVNKNDFSGFLQDWFNRQLDPTKKSETIQVGTERHGFEVLSADIFKSRVFVKKQESVVLVHKSMDGDLTSRKFLTQLRVLVNDSKLSALKFFLINGDKNDLPIFVAQYPCFAIFSKDSWENPLVYDKDNPTQLRELIDRRQELVFDANTDEDL